MWTDFDRVFKGGSGVSKLFSLFQIESIHDFPPVAGKRKDISQTLYRMIALSISLGFVHYVLQMAAFAITCIMILLSPDARKMMVKRKMSYLVYVFCTITSIVALFRQNWLGFGAGVLCAAMFVVIFAAREFLTKQMFENIFSFTIMASYFAVLVAVLEKAYYALMLNKPAERCYSVSINPNFYGIMAVLAILLCAYKVTVVNQNRSLFCVSAAVNFLGLVLCGSVSLLVVVCLMVLSYFLFSRNYKYLLVCTVIVAVGVTAVVFLPELMPRLSETQRTANSRFIIYQCAFDLLDEYPLFGSGFMSFRHWRLQLPDMLPAHVKKVNLAHNLVLDCLLCHGIVGTVLVGTTFGIFVYTVFKQRKRMKAMGLRSYAFALIAAVCVGLAPYCMMDTTYLWSQSGMVILLIFAMVGVDERTPEPAPAIAETPVDEPEPISV